RGGTASPAGKHSKAPTPNSPPPGASNGTTPTATDHPRTTTPPPLDSGPVGGGALLSLGGLDESPLQLRVSLPKRRRDRTVRIKPLTIQPHRVLLHRQVDVRVACRHRS